MSKEIQFVTTIHGNEPVPGRALRGMGEKHVVGNPLALLLRRRFVNRDLNASFGSRGLTYEELRAPMVLNQLNKEDLVVDFHTFSCESPPFAIIVDPSMLPLAASLGVDRVVYMKFSTKGGHALLNHRNGVSVEVGNHQDPKSSDLTKEIVTRLKTKGVYPEPIDLYEVFGKIETPGNYTNFVEHPDGFFPVLSGEKAYIKQGFYGLKARQVTK